MVKELRLKSARECPSNLTFDSLRAGELSATQGSEVEAHLRDCVSCTARHAALSRQAELYLASPRARASQQEVVRQRAKLRGLRTATLAACSLLAALAATFMLMPRIQQESVRSKGRPELGFYVKRAEHVFRGADGERVRPRDQLRFVVHVNEPVQLSIFGIDSRGVATLYYPVLGAPQQLLSTREEQPLAASVELDDVLGEERILGLFCDHPQPLEQLRRELEATQQLAERPGCAIDTLHIHKEREPP